MTLPQAMSARHKAMLVIENMLAHEDDENISQTVLNKINHILDNIAKKINIKAELGLFEVAHSFTYDDDIELLETVITPAVINALILQGYFVKNVTFISCECELYISW
jgi:hypothetical protein